MKNKKIKILIISIFIISFIAIFSKEVAATFYNFFTWEEKEGANNFENFNSRIKLGDDILVDIVPNNGMLRLNFRNEVLCIQNGQEFKNNTRSKVTRKITITGNTSKVETYNNYAGNGKTYTGDENLIMSYILSKDENDYYKTVNSGGDTRYLSSHDPTSICYIHGKTGRCYSPKQVAVYKKFKAWKDKVGMTDLGATAENDDIWRKK